MKRYRMLAATQITMAQVGTLLDMLQQGFCSEEDMTGLVGMGVLVEEPDASLNFEGLQDVDPMWTEINETGGIHKISPDAMDALAYLTTAMPNSVGEFIDLEKVKQSMSVFDARCCSNSAVRRSYRIAADQPYGGRKGYERASCSNCKASEERECPHESVRSNSFNANVSCRNCGVEIGV